MAIEWKIEQDNLAVFEVSGKLGKDEYLKIQGEIETLIQRIGHINILVLLKGFAGWQAAKGWEEGSTDHIDPYINKFAIVGDEKWRDLVEVFTLKGLRPVPIQYFASDSDELARLWLAAG